MGIASIWPSWTRRIQDPFLGIECDGATYHNSATAEIATGSTRSPGISRWRIIRIWSTDWVKDPIFQLERVIAAFDQRQCPGSEPRAADARLGTPEQPRMSSGEHESLNLQNLDKSSG